MDAAGVDDDADEGAVEDDIAGVDADRAGGTEGGTTTGALADAEAVPPLPTVARAVGNTHKNKRRVQRCTSSTQSRRNTWTTVVCACVCVRVCVWVFFCECVSTSVCVCVRWVHGCETGQSNGDRQPNCPNDVPVTGDVELTAATTAVGDDSAVAPTPLPLPPAADIGVSAGDADAVPPAANTPACSSRSSGDG